MKASEMRALSIEELQQKTLDLQGELFNAKVKHATGQLEDTAKMGRLRRDLARVNTVLSQKSGEAK